ncbi:hypothetical protein [uncultured Sunxiuqinia sp.]|uniref:hypothetical protein n=1 Tax=uncultured Sunxiuqinia sp. TaxID=1573825 RepID=UPI0026034A80|nr:hypothetical protein [uncultured Sunxiuqinia sp.]
MRIRCPRHGDAFRADGLVAHAMGKLSSVTDWLPMPWGRFPGLRIGRPRHEDAFQRYGLVAHVMGTVSRVDGLVAHVKGKVFQASDCVAHEGRDPFRYQKGVEYGFEYLIITPSFVVVHEQRCFKLIG